MTIDDFVEAGVFIKECPFAFVCESIGIHRDIIQYQLRLDECKYFLLKKVHILFTNINFTPDHRSDTNFHVILDRSLALPAPMVGGCNCGFYEEWGL